MATTKDSEAAVMLTLAALAYRGFSDVLLREAHEYVVRRAVLSGLEESELRLGEWELVWGPVTKRLAGDEWDASAMYVVRHRDQRRRYAIAVRGTNPISMSDWLYGDLTVATKVTWPFARDGAALSTSTAFGLRTLQRLAWSPPSLVAQALDTAYESVRDVVAAAWSGLRVWVSGAEKYRAALRTTLTAELEQFVTVWVEEGAAAIKVDELVADAVRRLRVGPDTLRRRVQTTRAHGTELLTFLKEQADASDGPLEILVTGHSKGGALAPALALWLVETQARDTPAEERWDKTGEAEVRCYAFAGPTPGNEAFAARIDALLGKDCVQIVNGHDVVPHAWDPEDLAKIPQLYDARSAGLAPLVEKIVLLARTWGYRHPTAAVVRFEGAFDERAPRGLAEEFVYQHMDAYLRHAGLPPEVDALTFFLG